MAYVIKHKPADFVVKEELELPTNEQGPYSFYRLEKNDRDHFSVLQEIERCFHTKRKYINVAGIKDKCAITTQTLSIFNGPKRDLSGRGFTLSFVGKGENRLNLGALKGNAFEITVRNIDAAPDPLSTVPNYFDTQRFGVNGDNHIIGKHLIQKQYADAIPLLEAQNVTMSGKVPMEKIRSLSKRLIQLYLHAYQSFLWNKVVQAYVKTNEGREVNGLFFPAALPEQQEVPILGFMTDLKEEPFGPIYNKVLKEEGLTQRDFLLRPLSVCIEGSTRPLLTPIQQFSLSSLEEDEAHQGKKKCTVQFFLQKGSYATIVIRALFG